jgi:hypothetical protein
MSTPTPVASSNKIECSFLKSGKIILFICT